MRISIDTVHLEEDEYKIYDSKDKAFFALLGSINGANTMRILLDHKVDIEYRIVKSIVVFPCRHREDAVTLWALGIELESFLDLKEARERNRYYHSLTHRNNQGVNHLNAGLHIYNPRETRVNPMSDPLLDRIYEVDDSHSN